MSNNDDALVHKGQQKNRRNDYFQYWFGSALAHESDVETESGSPAGKRQNHEREVKCDIFGTVASVSPLFEIALVLVRVDHVASVIVNANHSIV